MHKFPNEKYKSILNGLDYAGRSIWKMADGQFYPLKKGYYSHITFNDDR
jgi:hypothetical protein